VSLRRIITILVSIAGGLFLISYSACQEGFEHDQSGSCVIDPFMPPPFLGWEYWSQFGITLGVAATGLLIAAFMYWRNDG
jgi:hypothetical protein